MAAALVCDAHQVPATDFCLCGTNPVYLCAACIPAHNDKLTHDVFPIASLELYGALGNDKTELRRRNEVVKECLEFLNNVITRETAKFIKATALQMETVKCYQTWLENDHRCFDSHVKALRRDNAAVETVPRLSHLSQVLVERTQSFSERDERNFSSVPEKDSLELFNSQYKEALAAMPAIEQRQYNAEVRRAFLNQSQVLPHSPSQGAVNKMIDLYQDHMNLFDVTTCQWQPPIQLHRNIGVTDPPSTFIAPNQVFVCGVRDRQACTCHVADLVYVVGEDGSVQELQHMLTARAAHGLIWDPARKAVYVFGGVDRKGSCYTGQRLLSCEQFQSNEWSHLPNMYATRCYDFNPCWHAGVVYLCGGGPNLVETYDPRTNIFALQDFTLRLDEGHPLTVEDGEVLTVILNWSFYRLQQGRLTNEHHEHCYLGVHPVLYNGTVYHLSDTVCGISLTTGENKIVAKRGAK